MCNIFKYRLMIVKLDTIVSSYKLMIVKLDTIVRYYTYYYLELL